MEGDGSISRKEVVKGNIARGRTCLWQGDIERNRFMMSLSSSANHHHLFTKGDQRDRRSDCQLSAQSGQIAQLRFFGLPH